MNLFYRARVRWVALSAIPVLFCVAAVLQRKIDVQAATLSEANEELILKSPDAIKKLSLGYDALLADIYWTRGVQYYGREVNASHSDFHSLWPLLNVATTLDPQLEVAYHFGVIFLSEPEPIGAGRTDLAIQLAKKGISANPTVWQLGTDLGFLYYWRLKDYPHAAAAYLQASRIPNSPPWIKVMAARVSQTGGSIGTSQIIWAQIYTSTKDPSIRKEAGAQLQGLKAQEDMVQLGNLASEYKKRMGHYPVSGEELRVVGLLPGIPVDPGGFPYEFDADGKARLNPKTTFQMPKAPQVFSAPPSNTEASHSVQGRGTRVQ